MKPNPFTVKAERQKASELAPTLVARVINAGTINNEYRNACRWLGQKITYEDPFIVYYKVEKPILQVLGSKPFSEYINVDNAPEDIIFSRTASPSEGGVLFFDEGMTTIRIYCPRQKMVGIQTNIKEAVTEVLAEDYGIEVRSAPWRVDSNDMVFMKDGKPKKFLGVAYLHVANFVAFGLLLDFNADKIKGLYKLDHPKFLQKGDVKEITDVVGGLREANPALGEEVIPKVINRICRKMRWEPQEAAFAPEEEQIIAETMDELAREKVEGWLMTGKR